MSVYSRFKRLIWILIIVIGIGLLAFLGASIILYDDQYPLYTEDIMDYNSEKYPVNVLIFMDEIPNHVKVVSFSYYDYWHENKDIYLELNFESKEEMEMYLEQLCKYTARQIESTTNLISQNGQWFYTDTNPYNSSYTDLFCIAYRAWQNDDHYTGYKIQADEESFFCQYGIISYSYEELTVIQTYCSGYYEKQHEYIPQYFERFNVPLNNNTNRVFYVEIAGKTVDG